MSLPAGGATAAPPAPEHGRAAMTNPDPAAEPTTLGITKGQRADIAEIQAALIAERRRHVTTKETMDALITSWKEHHGNDHSQ